MSKTYLSFFRNQVQASPKGQRPLLMPIENPVEAFTARVEAAGCELILCPSVGNVIQYAQEHRILAEPHVLWQSELHSLNMNKPDEYNEQTILIAADAAAAETGTIFKAATETCPTQLLFLPQHLLIMVKKNQICNEYIQAYTMAKQAQPNFMNMHMITGPSRTADIQQILVLGAHGPIRVTIFLTEEE